MSDASDLAATTIHTKAQADAARFVDAGGEQISPDSLRARLSVETQREIDARMAAWFSTSSETATYDLEAVRELNRKAI